MLRVLAVEDDEAHARIINRAFEGWTDCQVKVVETVAQARNELFQEVYHVVIADLVLPDGRGIELIGNGQQHEPPVLVMTSQGDEKTAVEAMKMGAFDYVVKSAPTLLELPHLAQRVSREWNLIIEKREAENALRESEARNRAILNAVPDILLLHGGDGRVKACEGNIKSLPIPSDSLIGMPLSELVDADDYVRVREAFQDARATSSVVSTVYRSRLQPNLHFEARLSRYGTDEILAVLRDVSQQQSALLELSRLSGREKDVLELVMEGMANKKIAIELGISIKTVETHRANLMKKLNVRSVAELARIALTASDEVTSE